MRASALQPNAEISSMDGTVPQLFGDAELQ